MASVVLDKKDRKLILASVALPDKVSQRKVLLLAESIRTFAGSLSETPIWCFTSENEKQVSAEVKDRLLALNVTLIPFKIEQKIPRFPFIRKVILVALAESMALGKTDLFVWLNSDTIVLQEPKAFVLQDNKYLGYRPVHHTLVGSCYSEPLDPFWTLIYRYCNVPEEHVFPMMTHIDGTWIRPYFNAGLLITRPEKHLFRAWRDTFLKTYQKPALQKFYQKDERYSIFVHQALLTGVILSALKTDEIQELPPTYNYPLHLHAEDISTSRPSYLEELVTFRYENFFEDPEWTRNIPAREPLKHWIAKRLSSTKR